MTSFSQNKFQSIRLMGKSGIRRGKIFGNHKGVELEHKKGFSDFTDKQQKQAQDLGVTLRQRRKEMNVSLKEAENATSIRITYLQALEEGDMGKLISPVYAQGFFKQYAAFLGIDGESIVRQNGDIFKGTEAQEFDYGIGTLEHRGHPGAGIKWFPNALWICLFIVVIVFAWYFARFFGVL